MTFSLLDSLSIPGNPAKANEDAFAVRDAAAVVFDGATGLGEPLLPGPSDAAWIARFGANRLMAHLSEGKAAGDALHAALVDAQTSFNALKRRAPQQTWELPFASMMFVCESELGFEALWFGDCAALVQAPDAPISLIGEAFDKKAAERARVALLAEKNGLAPAAGISRAEYLPALRRARNTVNTPEGGYLFGPDPIATGHADRRFVQSASGTVLLLASDGFLALVSEYEAYDLEGLMAAAQTQGLAKLGEELRAIEAGDPEGRRYPRFKKSDDATALLLRLG